MNCLVNVRVKLKTKACIMGYPKGFLSLVIVWYWCKPYALVSYDGIFLIGASNTRTHVAPENWPSPPGSSGILKSLEYEADRSSLVRRRRLGAASPRKAGANLAQKQVRGE